MSFTNSWSLVGPLLCASAVLQCGCPLYEPLDLPDGGLGTPGVVTFEERKAVFAQIDALVHALPTTDVATNRQQLADSIRKLPHVAKVGITDTGVGGYFSDYRWFAIADNFDPGEATAPDSLSTSQPIKMDELAGSAANKNARLMNATSAPTPSRGSQRVPIQPSTACSTSRGMNLPMISRPPSTI
jgi:hypothetical protein